METADVQADVVLEYADFVSMVKRMKRVLKPRATGEALLLYEDGKLVIRTPGITLYGAAEGRWNGEVRIPIDRFLKYDRLLAKHQPVRLIVCDDKLKVNDITIPCEWLPGASKVISIPLDASYLQIYLLQDEYTDMEIAAAGLWGVYRSAHIKVETMIFDAYEMLKPLGIDHDELHKMCYDAVRKMLKAEKGKSPRK